MTLFRMVASVVGLAACGYPPLSLLGDAAGGGDADDGSDATQGPVGCAASLACPAPTDGKQTICGQIYDFETNQPFAQGSTGTQCLPGATTGPCSLGIRAYDAAALVVNPASPPLVTAPFYIDDCGRYRVPEITQPSGAFVALAIDDSNAGPGGTTNAVMVTTAKRANAATQGFEAFIVHASTVAAWAGGPSLTAGIYALVYRGHRAGFDPAVGVTVTIAPATNPTAKATDATRDYYFRSGSPSRTGLDAAASATTTNGTALLSGVIPSEVYSGSGGGLPAQCIWDTHAGAAIAGIIAIQIFRPLDAPGMTCPL
jgi:hypothetical protein